MGYDLDRFEGEVDQNMKCPICYKVIENPVQLDCVRREESQRHVFCRTCIIEKFAESETLKCPIDGEKFKRNTKRSLIQTPPKQVLDSLSQLEIRCDLIGCSKTVKLNELEFHVQTCEFIRDRVVACRCGASFKESESSSHSCNTYRELSHENQRPVEPKKLCPQREKTSAWDSAATSSYRIFESRKGSNEVSSREMLEFEKQIESRLKKLEESYSERIDMVKAQYEAKLEETNQEQLQRIESGYQKDIENLKKTHQCQLGRLEEKFKKEVDGLKRHWVEKETHKPLKKQKFRHAVDGDHVEDHEEDVNGFVDEKDKEQPTEDKEASRFLSLDQDFKVLKQEMEDNLNQMLDDSVKSQQEEVVKLKEEMSKAVDDLRKEQVQLKQSLGKEVADIKKMVRDMEDKKRIENQREEYEKQVRSIMSIHLDQLEAIEDKFERGKEQLKSSCRQELDRFEQGVNRHETELNKMKQSMRRWSSGGSHGVEEYTESLRVESSPMPPKLSPNHIAFALEDINGGRNIAAQESLSSKRAKRRSRDEMQGSRGSYSQIAEVAKTAAMKASLEPQVKRKRGRPRKTVSTSEAELFSASEGSDSFRRISTDSSLSQASSGSTLRPSRTPSSAPSISKTVSPRKPQKRRGRKRRKNLKPVAARKLPAFAPQSVPEIVQTSTIKVETGLSDQQKLDSHGPAFIAPFAGESSLRNLQTLGPRIGQVLGEGKLEDFVSPLIRLEDVRGRGKGRSRPRLLDSCKVPPFKIQLNEILPSGEDSMSSSAQEEVQSLNSESHLDLSQLAFEPSGERTNSSSNYSTLAELLQEPVGAGGLRGRSSRSLRSNSATSEPESPQSNRQILLTTSNANPSDHLQVPLQAQVPVKRKRGRPKKDPGNISSKPLPKPPAIQLKPTTGVAVKRKKGRPRKQPLPLPLPPPDVPVASDANQPDIYCPLLGTIEDRSHSLSSQSQEASLQPSVSSSLPTCSPPLPACPPLVAACPAPSVYPLPVGPPTPPPPQPSAPPAPASSPPPLTLPSEAVPPAHVDAQQPSLYDEDTSEAPALSVNDLVPHPLETVGEQSQEPQQAKEEPGDKSPVNQPIDLVVDPEKYKDKDALAEAEAKERASEESAEAESEPDPEGETEPELELAIHSKSALSAIISEVVADGSYPLAPAECTSESTLPFRKRGRNAKRTNEDGDEGTSSGSVINSHESDFNIVNHILQIEENLPTDSHKRFHEEAKECLSNFDNAVIEGVELPSLDTMNYISGSDATEILNDLNNNNNNNNNSSQHHHHLQEKDSGSDMCPVIDYSRKEEAICHLGQTYPVPEPSFVMMPPHQEVVSPNEATDRAIKRDMAPLAHFGERPCPRPDVRDIRESPFYVAR